MNPQQPLQPNPTIFGIGTIIGLALGLFIGWVLWPVEWEGATLRDLDTSEKAEYIAAVADAFVIYDSPEAATNARRRLAPLGESLADEFTAAIRYFRNSNQPEQNIRISNIRQLANSLGVLIPDLELAPDNAQSQPAAEAIVATVPAESTLPAGNVDSQSQAGDAGQSASTDGTNTSWVRSILWFLAVLLIVGGAIFLLGASGLINWHHWWSKWTAWVTGNRRGGDIHRVDEFDEDDDYNDYDRFDDYEQFDYVDEFDEPGTVRTPGKSQRTSKARDAFAGAPETYSFDSEAFDEDDRFSSRSTARSRSAQESDAPEMFRTEDFAEVDANAAIPGYDIAYAGYRYADDEETAGGKHSATPDGQANKIRQDYENAKPNNAEFNDEFDDQFDDEFDDAEFDDAGLDDDGLDDDVADANWRVPTVESVLASTPEEPTTTVEPQERNDKGERQQEEGHPQEEERADPLTDGFKQRRQLPDEPVSFSEQAAALPVQQRASPPQQAPQSPRQRVRHKVIDQHTLQYQLGIPEYDESKPIVDPASGKYIGEFGMGASVKHGLHQGNPDQVVALEVWLFDKTDEQNIGNRTRILLSEYAVDQKLDELFLKERRDNPRPFTAQRGVHFQLEGQSLLLDCTIVDVAYIENGAGKGMFQRIKVDMSVHQKA